jgi:hypothetical protein
MVVALVKKQHQKHWRPHQGRVQSRRWMAQHKYKRQAQQQQQQQQRQQQQQQVSVCLRLSPLCQQLETAASRHLLRAVRQCQVRCC